MSIIIITMAHHHHHHHRGLMFKASMHIAWDTKWITRRRRRKGIQTQQKRERKNRFEMEKLSLHARYLFSCFCCCFPLFFWFVFLIDWIWTWSVDYYDSWSKFIEFLGVCMCNTYIQTDRKTLMMINIDSKCNERIVNYYHWYKIFYNRFIKVSDGLCPNWSNYYHHYLIDLE